jgi:hypothetical protein
MVFFLLIAFLNSFSFQEPFLLAKENELFRFYFLPDNQYSVTLLMEKSESYFQEQCSYLNFQPQLPEKISVYILPENKSERKTGLKFTTMPNWVAGFADTKRGMIIIRTTSVSIGLYKNVIDIFRHELSHIILKQFLGKNYAQLPWWLNEGYAMWQAREWSIQDSIFLSESLIRGSYIPLNEMTNPFDKSKEEVRQMYIEALSFFLYLNNEFGPEAVRDLFYRIREGQSFDDAFRKQFNQEVARAEANWKRGLQLKYKWLPIISSSTVFWIFVILLVFMGYVRKKKIEREILKKWEREDFFC